jgi:hypothetical protein
MPISPPVAPPRLRLISQKLASDGMGAVEPGDYFDHLTGPLYAALGPISASAGSGTMTRSPCGRWQTACANLAKTAWGWPFAALEFFAGGVGPQRLVKAAKASGHRDQLCEAYFIYFSAKMRSSGARPQMRCASSPTHMPCAVPAPTSTPSRKGPRRSDEHAALSRSSRN